MKRQSLSPKVAKRMRKIAKRRKRKEKARKRREEKKKKNPQPTWTDSRLTDHLLDERVFFFSSLGRGVRKLGRLI